MTTEHDPFFYTDPGYITSREVLIEGDEARHLKLVRRARPGDLVHVSDGRGRVMDVRLVQITLKKAIGVIENESTVDPPVPRVSILQALTKGAKVDWVVQKLVEIGVSEVTIFVSARSVPRWDSTRASKALSRWQMIAREAAKQSRRPWLARIDGPLEASAIAGSIDGTILIADERARMRLRDALPPDPPERLTIVVGPEGGLDPRDLEILDASDSQRVQLGPQILRTETAPLVAASIVMYHYGLIG